MTIKSLLAYTSSGQVLYKWEKESNSIGRTHAILVPGFFSALSTVLSTFFQDRLQRLILGHNAIVLIGKEINIKHNQESSKKFVLISALVDLNDDIGLIHKIISKLFEILSQKPYLDDEKLITNSILDQEINFLINSKEYSRTKKKFILSTLLVIVAIFISTFMYLFDYDIVLTNTSGFISIPEIISIIAAALLIIPTSAIAGNKISSGLAGLIGSFIGSIFSFIFFQLFTQDIQYLEGFGTPIVYFSLSILLGLVYGSIGGLLMERRYLNS